MKMNDNTCKDEVEQFTNKDLNTELNNTSVTLESLELNESERDIMKGDTVGDTIYSARWIIKILKSLLKISDEDFTSALEEDLCTLWDITADKDVVIFLLKFDIFEVLNHVIRSTSNPRLMEILFGIIGNACCHNEALLQLQEKDEPINAIFYSLTDDDPNTLLQIVRIFQCFMWDIIKNKTSSWMQKFNECNYFGDRVSFILANSENDELLSGTLDLVEQIVSVCTEENNLLEKWFNIDELACSVLECLKTKEYSQKMIQNGLAIYNHIIKLQTFETTDFDKKVHRNQTMILLKQILKSFSLKCMIPMSDDEIFCIGTSVEIMMWFLKHRHYYESDVIAFVPTLLIAFKIDYERVSTDMENLTREVEFLQYLEESWHYIKRILDPVTTDSISKMCRCILELEKISFNGPI